MSEPDPKWQEFNLDGLRDRLLEIKALLEQAAAVGLARDTERLEAMTELAQKSREETHGGKPARRYR